MSQSAAPEVKPLGDENHHYWLAVAMAKAAGVDLQKAMDEGTLSHEDWAGLVTRCRGCDWERDGGCGRWLKLALESDDTSDVPETCVNRTVFDRIERVSDRPTAANND